MKINLHFRIAAGGGVLAMLLFFNPSLHAQKWEKIQPDILYAQDKDKGLNVKVGFGTDAPTAMLDVFKRTRLRGNVAADSSLSAFSIIGQQAQFATAVVTGAFSADRATIDGITISKNQITSSTGTVGFDGNNLSTTGTISSSSATIDGITISSGKIISATQSISFDGNNLNTTGDIFAATVSASSKLEGQILSVSGNANIGGTLNAQHILQNGNPLLTSQWTTNPVDSSISFNGNVFVKNLNSAESINIGTFRFSNGGVNPLPVIIDSIRTPFPMTLSSGANQIRLDADTVNIGNAVSIAPSPTAGRSRLSVQGDITSTGTLFSGSLAVTNLAGTGNRVLYVDSAGNFKTILPITNCGSSTPLACGWTYFANASPALWFLTPAGNTALYMTEVSNAPKVGIGCNNPAYTLDVSGTARAKEFRVNLGGCDFVFNENYLLLSLQERKIIVLKQKHLLNVISAKEMQQGTSLGETMMGILQNVEEHEQYLYQHQDEIDKFKSEIEILKKEIAELKKK